MRDGRAVASSALFGPDNAGVESPVALTSVMGWCIASGARPKTSNASASTQPWVASLGTDHRIPLPKTAASLVRHWIVGQMTQSQLHNS